MSDTRVAAEIEPEFATRGACAFARWAQEERKMREVRRGPFARSPGGAAIGRRAGAIV